MTVENRTETDLTFTLNGRQVACVVPNRMTLMDLLRDEFRCQGVRSSCERGVCGACSVLVDGVPLAACSTFAFEADRSTVETVEGLTGPEGEPSPEQQAFTECGGFQCGYCTSGMLMMTRALLRVEPNPDRATVREWIASNTCRCTGYEMIMESVERAAELTVQLEEGRR